LILLAFLAFLFPLAVYCVILAFLNRRPHPVLVSGAWDFAGVLFAASGFLLIGGPTILAGFNQRWREAWLLRRSPALPGLSLEYRVWLGLWVLYFIALLAGSVALLWRRRRLTSVYNVEPAAFDEALARALDRLQLPWWRGGNQVLVGSRGPEGSEPECPPDQAVPAPEQDILEKEAYRRAVPPWTAKPRAGWVNQEAVLELDPFPALRHVTLRWSGDAGPLRKEIEGELGRALTEVWTGENPAGVWFLSIAAGLFSLIFFDLLLSYYRIWQQRR
jgi:hypothetical protein